MRQLLSPVLTLGQIKLILDSTKEYFNKADISEAGPKHYINWKIKRDRRVVSMFILRRFVGVVNFDLLEY